MRSRMPSPRESMMKGMMGGTETINFKKTESDTIMIRSLDFTVEPDTTYRFRVRIVVYNPNKDREDVNPGVDTKSAELHGPWSEPTEEVTMPADVTAYACNRRPRARAVRSGSRSPAGTPRTASPSSGIRRLAG